MRVSFRERKKYFSQQQHHMGGKGDLRLQTVVQSRERLFAACTDMQANMWARLRDSCPGAREIHAT